MAPNSTGESPARHLPESWRSGRHGPARTSASWFITIVSLAQLMACNGPVPSSNRNSDRISAGSLPADPSPADHSSSPETQIIPATAEAPDVGHVDAVAETLSAGNGPNEATAESDAPGEESSATASDNAATVSPPDAEALAIFNGSPEDPDPRRLSRAAHYWAGNEPDLWAYEQDLAGLGGGYVGVGADQGYLFIGWQRPAFAWLIDYDRKVLATHSIHQAFFEAASSPEEYLALWEESEAGRALLSTAFEGDEQLAPVLKVYARAAEYVARRLRRLRDETGDLGLSCFVNDQASFQYIVDMYAAGRIRPMLANLLDERGIQGIGAAARQLDVPIRALYLSNAEYYWDYSEQFRSNMAALHFDERSVVLRTEPRGRHTNSYTLKIQPASLYLEWLAEPRVESVRTIPCRDAERAELRFELCDEEIEAWRERREVRKNQKKNKKNDAQEQRGED